MQTKFDPAPLAALDRLRRAQRVLGEISPHMTFSQQRVLLTVMYQTLRGNEDISQALICRITGLKSHEVSYSVKYFEIGVGRPDRRAFGIGGILTNRWRVSNTGMRTNTSHVELTPLGHDIMWKLIEALEPTEKVDA